MRKCAKTDCPAEATHFSQVELFTEGSDEPMRTVLGVPTCLEHVLLIEMLDRIGLQKMGVMIASLHKRAGEFEIDRSRIVALEITPENLKLCERMRQVPLQN